MVACTVFTESDSATELTVMILQLGFMEPHTIVFGILAGSYLIIEDNLGVLYSVVRSTLGLCDALLNLPALYLEGGLGLLVHGALVYAEGIRLEETICFRFSPKRWLVWRFHGLYYAFGEWHASRQV